MREKMKDRHRTFQNRLLLLRQMSPYLGMLLGEYTSGYRLETTVRKLCLFLGTQNVTQNVTQTKQAARYVQILNMLLANRRTPLREIAQMLNVSERTVKRDLNVIRQSYHIQWIGSPKTGRWEIENK